MRRVYLVRHAMPDIPLGERWCIGRTDLPLGTVGRMQAALLPFVPELRGKPVFCSHLQRAVSTAVPLCPEPQIREGLEEQDMGEWDGLSFTEIMRRYPALYAAREKDPSLMPDGAESMDAVRTRMTDAVLRCLEETDGDVVIVSHKSAIDSLTGRRRKLLHTSVSVLEYEEGAVPLLMPVEVGRLPHPELTEACLALLTAAGTPGPVIAHCQAVAEEAMRLTDEVPVPMDRSLLYAAALLHDIARTQPNHARIGADWIRALGYPEAADLIAQHHDLAPDARNGTGPFPDGAAILYLADKYIQGTERVTLEQRFRESGKKCASAEAQQAHRERDEMARSIEERLAALRKAQQV